MPKLAGDEVNQFYFQRGQGPDIVWVPGGDQRGEDFEYQIAAFEGDFRNTSYDPRGVGETECSAPTPWSIADFARDCAELIRAVCETPVFLTGLSMGSLIVQQVALDFPELVRCAIPMGTAAKPTGFSKEWMEAEVEFFRAGGRLSREFAIHHYGAFLFPSEVLGDEELWNKVKEVADGAYGARDSEMLIAQWEACIDFDVLDRLPDCKVPMHVVAFSQDMQTPPQLGRKVAEAAPDGHFHLLEGLGHGSLVGHRPDEVNACIRSIIDGYL